MHPLAVIFDVDGVLVDSLPAHLQICAELSRQHDLDLAIPGPAEFRELVRSGVPISPMAKFFEAVGFPAPLARDADAEYEATFADRFAPEPFAGVAEMLAGLRERNVELGIVTANTRRNVEQALGTLLEHFRPERVFSRDHVAGSTKAEALRTLAADLDLPHERVFYVGDQPADARAAAEVGLPFIGATYGWGIAQGDERRPGPLAGFRLADAPEAIVELVFGATASQS